MKFLRHNDPSQATIDFDAPVTTAPAATTEDVERVVGVLAAAGAWMTAAGIAEMMGLEPTENNKRKVRAIAEAARPGIMSFPNSPGYKLAHLCTQEEWDTGLNAWSSLKRKITQTEATYLRAYHSRACQHAAPAESSAP